jgi:hypothetical protein
MSVQFVSLALVVIDFFVSESINSSYYSINNECGGSAPSPVITAILALTALAISLYFTLHAFKKHHTWLGIFSSIFTLLVLLGGAASFWILVFVLCI